MTEFTNWIRRDLIKLTAAAAMAGALTFGTAQAGPPKTIEPGS